jgi:hypothetical protein
MVQKNVLYTLVAKAAQTGATSASVVSDLASQEVAIVGADGAIVTSVSGKKDLRWVRRNPLSGELEYSFFWDADDLVSHTTSAYSADVQFLGYLGYNGSSGELLATASTVFTPKLVIKDCLTTYGNKNMLKEFVYKSGSSSTQYAVAFGLSSSFANAMSKEPEKYVDCAVICSATVTTSNDFINDATVTNGAYTVYSDGTAQVETITLSGTSGTATVAVAGGLSKLATFDTDLDTTADNFVTAFAADYAAVGITIASTGTGTTDGKIRFTAAVKGTAFSAPTITNASGNLAGSVAHTTANVAAFTYATSSALAVGDALRIGSVGGGTALTSNVYKVTAISGTAGNGTTYVTLDRAVTEATGTYAASSHDIEVIPNATLINASTDFGLKFTGHARTNFSPGLFRYMVYDFDILPGVNFADVLVTVTTNGKKGVNTYEAVTEEEWFAQGNRGYGYRVDVIPVDSQVTTESGASYSCLSLAYKLDQFTNIVGQTPASLGQVNIYGKASLIAILHGYL